jgi:nucleotide-binding universal stress UspA family protein
METIVVGYDGSESAGRALARAAELAEALSARLVVVSVSESMRLPEPAPVLEPVGPMLVPGPAGGPPPTGGTTPPPEADRRVEPTELARRRLEQARTELARRPLEADYVAAVGPPAQKLLEIADERDADLIVVGSREHGFLERLLAQPVDEAVARRAGRDVLLVY